MIIIDDGLNSSLDCAPLFRNESDRIIKKKHDKIFKTMA